MNKITSKTRVCSKHFKDEDFNAPDNAGRRLLKKGTVPTVFSWATASNNRRKIIRHVERCVRKSTIIYVGQAIPNQ